MDHIDAIIVGAGPGGSSAAYHLAKLGARVLLIDKERFPRDKTCGDGISGHSLALLGDMGLESWLNSGDFARPRGLRIGAPDGTISSLEPSSLLGERFGLARIIPRKILDMTLVEAATQAGAHFVDRARASVLDLETSGACVRVQTRDRTEALRSQIVIAADGTRGSFGQRLGLQEGPLLSVAARVYVEANDLDEGFVDLLYESSVLPCYGWVFPVGNGICNVGIGLPINQIAGGNLLRRLERFLSTNPHVRARLPKYRIVSKPRGAPLYAGFRTDRVYRNRLLAVGDAAGLINPFIGSGIGRALGSGKIAAHCAYRALSAGDCSASSLAVYGEELSASFGRRHKQMKAVQCLARHDWIVNRIVQMLRDDDWFRERFREALSHRAYYGDMLLSPRVLLRLLLGM